MLLVPLSDSAQAFRDTLLHKAAGSRLTELSRLYGMPFVGPWEDSWRGALKAAAMGPRGTLGCTWDYLEKALSHLHVTYDVRVSGLSPYSAVAVGSQALPAVTLIGRIGRLAYDGNLYRIEGITDKDGGTNLAGLNFVQVGTTYWKAAPDFAELGSDIVDTTITMMSYCFREPTWGDTLVQAGGENVWWLQDIYQVGQAPGAGTVEICLYNDAADVPATYLVDEVTETVTVSFVDSNPDTITRASGDFTALFSDGDPLTVTGSANNDTPGTASSGGPGAYTITSVTATTITLAPSVTLTVEGPVEVTLSSTKARTSGQPHGGQVQTDEFEPGDQSLGPYPVYLTGPLGFGGEVKDVLDLLLAAGIRSVWSAYKEP